MGRGPNGTLFYLPHSTMHCVKLGIHGEAAPLQWRVNTAHHSNFQPIHLGWPFSNATCKLHSQSLQSPRTIAPNPPTFKTESFASKREPHSPFPYGCSFLSFRNYERASPPLPHGCISVL
ncbi:hypothetical protein AVEN_240870-1 [Araneus ventricosus]|uniref:Uncharacterized protein n=1 Tax=Araneus ventricosus TaxID=182803 RepID=A0A4Y2MPM8_ARAVE|nr:hypothetical protein AVEN_240870-1 [Araneus ventricosus]